MILVIGNKSFSSWSLRPWLLLSQFSIPFEEKLIVLNKENTDEEILKVSPAGHVPVLIDDQLVIWDSLAICEYANEKFPIKQMWPKDLKTRALARAVSAEMHSGFQTMRQVMSHDLTVSKDKFESDEALPDILRVKEIWRDCLNKSKGPFLFGEFSIADAMYAPVVNRFISYGVPIEPEFREYMANIRNLPAHQKWIQAGLRENF